MRVDRDDARAYSPAKDVNLQVEELFHRHKVEVNGILQKRFKSVLYFQTGNPISKQYERRNCSKIRAK